MKNNVYDIGVWLLKHNPKRVEIPRGKEYLKIRAQIMSHLPEHIPFTSIQTDTFIHVATASLVAACLSVAGSVQLITLDSITSLRSSGILGIDFIQSYYGM